MKFAIIAAAAAIAVSNEVEAETEELPQELQEIDLAQLDEAPMDMEESLAEVEEDRRRSKWSLVKHHVRSTCKLFNSMYFTLKRYKYSKSTYVRKVVRKALKKIHVYKWKIYHGKRGYQWCKKAGVVVYF